MMDNLIAMGTEAKVELNKEQLKVSESLIKTQLKALIARDLWDMNEYYHVMNSTNESVKKAVEILQTGDYEKKLTRLN